MRDLAELFERFRSRGDLAALGEVFDRTAPRLIGLALHLCGNAADAEDLVQSTFVVAISKSAAFEAGRNLEAWLTGILAGEARNHARRAALRRAEALPELAEATPDPQASALRAECIAEVRRRVDALPPEQRQALLLKLQHGLATAEIAEVLGLAPGAVRMRIHRGIEALRRLLPASLASLLVAVLPARGTKAIRRDVLEHARSMLPAPAASGAIGMVYSAAVAACILLGLLLWRGDASSDGQGAHAPPFESAAANAGLVPDVPAHRNERLQRASSTRLEAAPAAGALLVRVAVRLPPESAPRTMPVANALVQCWPGARATPPFDDSVRELRTDENGEIRLTDLPPGTWSVAFLADWDAEPRTVRVGPAAESVIEIVQPGGRIARGRVIDEHALPVPDAEIWATDPGGFSVLGKYSIPRRWDPSLRLAGRTDGTGRFELALGQREATIGARKQGFGPSRGHSAFRTSDAEATLVLGSEWAAVRGTVLDPDGGPVADAAVWVLPAGQDARRGADGILLGPRVRQVTRTDAAGRFCFESLPAGSQRISARAPPYLGGVLDVMLPAYGSAEATLHLTAGIAIVGTVRRADGTPATELSVAALPSRRANGHFARVDLRDDGTFQLDDLPHRSLVLSVDGRGGQPVLQHELRSPAAGVLRCDLTLPDLPDLRGRLCDPDGAPLQGWRVIATAMDMARYTRAARTDPGGRFLIQDLPGSRFRLAAHAEDGASDDPACEIEGIPAGASELELRIPADRIPSAAVHGILTDGNEGLWSGAELALCRDSSPSEAPPLRRTTSGIDGSFRVDRLTGGRYALWLLRAEGRPRALVEFEVARGETRALGGVHVAPLATLRIEARHASGAAWRGDPPEYHLLDPHGNPPDGFVALDASGSTFRLEAGAYRVQPRGTDLIGEPQDVRLTAGESRVLPVTVAVGRTRSLVFNGDGRHRPEAGMPLQVEVRRADGSRYPSRDAAQLPDLRGFRYWCLQYTFPFGRYDVTAWTTSGLRYATSFEVREDLSDRTRIDVPLVQ